MALREARGETCPLASSPVSAGLPRLISSQASRQVGRQGREARVSSGNSKKCHPERKRRIFGRFEIPIDYDNKDSSLYFVSFRMTVWLNTLIGLAVITIMLLPTTARADNICPIISRDSIIRYAASGVGSPYVWGGDKWNPNNRKWGGADCSGYILKAWQIPYAAGYKESVGHPYNTYSFYYKNTHWYSISRSNLAKGDMLVYRSSSGGHSVIYHYGDKWGSAVVYEARSRKTGIIHGQRYFPSYFKARRRHRLVDADSQLMATAKLENGTFVEAKPNTKASSTLYFDYFQRNNVLAVRNTDIINNAQVSVYSMNRNIIKSSALSLSPFQINQQGQSWSQTGFMKLVSGGQKLYAARKTSDGSLFLARNVNDKAYSNTIDYFEPRRDVLYITNPNARTVKAAIYLLNNGRLDSRYVVRIRPRTVSKIDYRRSRKKHFSAAYVRINSGGGRVYVVKRTVSSNFVSATPLSRLRRLNFIPNFRPWRDLLYVTNPSSKRVKVVIDYIQNSRSYFKVTKYIGPRDVIGLDYRRRLKSLGEVYLRIRSTGPILASKRMERARYQVSEPSGTASKISYIVNFNPSSQALYVINPINSSQKATVNIIANGQKVYSNTYTISRNTQKYINLTGTSAINYSNTYVQVLANF